MSNWIADGRFVMDGESTIARVFPVSETRHVSELETTARLMAAAPEMLEALMLALSALPQGTKIFSTVLMAIAKAEGTNGAL